jgi:alkylation response protein AidB-like acyl-CoA dehydrogenase
MIYTATRLLGDIRKLAPNITARAREIETLRRIPVDLVDALKSIGLFRMFVPQSHSGLELDLPSALELIAELGKVDGSVGWTVMITSASAMFLPYLPRGVYDLIYQRGPDVIIAGSTQPAGIAEMTASGWRVSGRWPLATGCDHADWMFGACFLSEGGKRLLATDSGGREVQIIRRFLLPSHNWRIDDTWHAVGLRGTGSHHITLNEAAVPEDNFFDLGTSEPCLSGPLYQAVRQLIVLMHGAVAVGIAEGALGDLIELASIGPDQQRYTETFQRELGWAEAQLRAARALLQVEATAQWQHVLSGMPNDEISLTRVSQTVTWITAACIRVVDACFALGGSSALYETSPLQRRLRDLHAVAQHAITRQQHYVNAGKLLLRPQPASH